MSAVLTLSTPDGDPAPAGRADESQDESADEGRALVARQLAMLGRLAEAGLNLALAIERQATAAEGQAPDAAAERLGALALAYGRVSRAVRLSVALQGRLLKELQALDDVAARMREREQADASQAGAAQAAARKGRVERIVGRVIADAVEDQAEADRVAEEAWDRLEHDDIYGDLLRKPVSEIIERICKDLGLAPDWTRLAQEAWAEDEIASGAAGAPLLWLRGRDRPAEQPAADASPTELRAASP